MQQFNLIRNALSYLNYTYNNKDLYHMTNWSRKNRSIRGFRFLSYW